MDKELLEDVIARTDAQYYRGASDWPHKFASALEAALLEGKCLVPVEPTEGMLQEAWQTLPHIPLSKYNIKILWACMLQAAPKGGSHD